MNISKNPPNQLYWLESLRGIACMSVVFEHYFSPKTYYFSFGNFGVIVFFLISGFIVTASTVRKTNETVFSFILLRIGRLYPAYIISVFFSYFVYSATNIDLLANLTMFQRFFGVSDINGVYWTLQIEWVFYFIIAASLMFSGVSKHKLKIAFLAFVCIALVFGAMRFYYNLRAPSAVPIGLSVILISSIFTTENNIIQRSIYGGIFLVFIVLISSILSYSKDWGYDENPYRFIISDLSAIAIFLLFKLISLRSSIFEFFGRISFSLYLFHQPCSKIVKMLIGEEGAYVIVASLIFSIVLSYLIFIYIEDPVNRRVKFFVKSRVLRQVDVSFNSKS